MIAIYCYHYSHINFNLSSIYMIDQPSQPKQFIPAPSIRTKRIEKQLQSLKNINYILEEIPETSVINIIINDQKLSAPLLISLAKDYPFQQPTYQYQPVTKSQSIIVSQLLGSWSPKFNVLQIYGFLIQQINSLKKQRQQLSDCPSFWFFGSKQINTSIVLIMVILAKLFVGLGGHSGKNDWPNLGDFQAHRNWMSITVNRPIQDWYTQQGPYTQMWWRIDYPPVAAYLSYAFAMPMAIIEPQALNQARGYQSQALQGYMRFTVILTDLLFYSLLTILLFSELQPDFFGNLRRKNSTYELNSNSFPKSIKLLLLLIALMRPDLLLIDHGHFQYNSLIVGLIIGSIYCLLSGKYYYCCILYTIALQAKQMSAYFSLAIFAGLIGFTLKDIMGPKWIRRLKFSEILKSKIIVPMTREFLTYGLIVILLTLIIWLPWIIHGKAGTVLQAIFPVHRGLYQLKVGNFWCITDVFMNWQKHISKNHLMLICSISCLFASLPAMISIVLSPSTKVLLRGFLNISMGFFLFSFHVHQKSIILPLTVVPILMIFDENFRGLGIDLILIGCFGMYHLLKQDGQTLQYFCILPLFYFLGQQFLEITKRYRSIHSKIPLPMNFIQHLHNKIYNNFPKRQLILIFLLTCLHLSQLFVQAPSKLPYLYHLLFAFMVFLYSIYTYAYTMLSITNDLIIQLDSQQRKNQ